jgi:hypothetical protein
MTTSEQRRYRRRFKALSILHLRRQTTDDCGAPAGRIMT